MDYLMEKFEKTFLTEFPINLGIGYENAIQILRNNITEIIGLGIEPIQLPNGIFKIDLLDIMYYWIATQNEIVLAAELEKTPLALVIRLVGKDVQYANRTPYAYELYEIILNDMHRDLRLLSDQSLTEKGFKTWEKLFDMGVKISIYDLSKPGKTFTPFKSKEEMKEFFQKGAQYKNYQFVLSESKEGIANLIGQFGIKRYQELMQEKI